MFCGFLSRLDSVKLGPFKYLTDYRTSIDNAALSGGKLTNCGAVDIFCQVWYCGGVIVLS